MVARFSQRVSVIVTVKNDAIALQELLQNLRAQTYQPDEIILSVANSSDDTLKVANWAAESGLAQVVFAGEANRATGRNLGFAAASGDILVSIDAGCRPDKNWLAELIEPWKNESPDLVGGKTLGDPQTAWEAAQVPFVLPWAKQSDEIPLPATRNLAVSAAAYERIGPFLPHLNTAEDYEWSRRARSLGVDLRYQELAIVWWRPRTTPLDFWKMIVELTQGDIIAHTWRPGHLTMILRYLLFALLLIVQPSIGLAVWMLYGAVKSAILSRKAKTSWSQTFGFQYLTDSAVLFGIFTGWWKAVKASPNQT